MVSGMRPRFRLFLIALALGLAAGASRPAAQGTWASVTKGKLAVSMPCNSNWTSERTTTDTQTGPYTTHLYVCSSGDERYIAGITEYAPEFRPNTTSELNANRDNFIKGVSAILLTSSPLTYDGLPALDFSANWKGTHLLTCRVVMQGNSPFMLAVATPLNQDRAANIGRFLSSMRISK
jgi:hypothetical protein